jgi:hypothetical protein
MNRSDYIYTVIQTYIDLPDTPNAASPADFNIAATFADDEVPIDHVIRAIKLGFIRRWGRDDSAGKLPPIRSLAYFKRVLVGLSDEELGADFGIYVKFKFDAIRPDPIAWIDDQKHLMSKKPSDIGLDR